MATVELRLQRSEEGTVQTLKRKKKKKSTERVFPYKRIDNTNRGLTYAPLLKKKVKRNLSLIGSDWLETCYGRSTQILSLHATPCLVTI
ncbi:hypothetical protein CEXT_350801 [Caerostris extrusa]|uniref:Uncharacterized protein n=1 Tax=Caerostris extrusa TaxID=172846 RepID=A0AAV4VZ97_CAEEX|nr:hypothetical protein CEXT_350801 [Caerostris extrusa]